MLVADGAAGDNHMLRRDAVLGFGYYLAIGETAIDSRRDVGHDFAHGQGKFAAERGAERFRLFAGRRTANVACMAAFQPCTGSEVVYANQTVAIANFDAHFLDVVELAFEQVDRHAEPQLDNFFVRKCRVRIVGDFRGCNVAAFGRTAEIEGDRWTVGPSSDTTCSEQQATEPNTDGRKLRKHHKISSDKEEPRRRAPLVAPPGLYYVMHSEMVLQKENPGRLARAMSFPIG